MKRIFIYALFNILSIASSYGQFTSSDFVIAGDSVLISTSTEDLGSLDFSNTGSTAIWDFTSLQASSQALLRFEDPDIFGYGFPWCLANGFLFDCVQQFEELTNIGTLQLDTFDVAGFGVQNVANHYKKEEDAYTLAMVGLQVNLSGIPIPLTITYDQKDTLYRFPVILGDAYETSSSRTFDLTGLGIPFVSTQLQSRSHSVDAHGTLMTPFGTYENTLRLKTTTIVIDSSYIDTTLIATENIILEYRWFNTNEKYPILEASGNIVDGIEMISQVTYLDSARCLAPGSLFAYSPLIPEIDAVTGEATVDLINLSSLGDSFIWDFGNGESSTMTNPSTSYFCFGAQNISLIVGRSCDDTLFDTLTLPIFIGDSLGLTTIDTSVTVSPDGLMLDDVDYDLIEWIDCSTGEVLATNTSLFTPDNSGFYKAQITKFNCVKETQCLNYIITSSDDFTVNGIRAFTAYPNPIERQFFIRNSQHIRRATLMDALGNVLHSWMYPIKLNRPSYAPRGVYFLRLDTKNGNVFYQSVILK